MRIEPEIDGVDVVLLGDFNPAIFTPAWFALNGLLPESAAASAELQIAHQRITAFNTDWLRLQVASDRFSAGTSQAPHVRLHDLVVRVFKEHLHHTPLSAFGINREVHFQVRSLAARDRMGRTLAPVEPWGAWGRELGSDGLQGGMTSLTMSRIDPEGRPAGGRTNVTVEPSSRIGEGRFGVCVRVNDHHAIDDAAGPGASGRLMELFADNFDASLERSEGIIDHIMSLATHQEV